MHTVRVLSHTGRFIIRQLQFDYQAGALFVTIGQQDWYVQAHGPNHFRCTRPRFKLTAETPPAGMASNA